MKEKELIIDKYSDYADRLKRVKQNITSLSSGKNTLFLDIKNSFLQALEREITLSYEEMEYSINGVDWDKLCIAFFGETGAGKSTIIETLRILYGDRRYGNEGVIVGDGRPDYTQKNVEYNLNINGTPFTLIDVPGIEGCEDNYKEEIKKALRKAHLVFYVHGSNIKPNKATAEKIKGYLGDWVNVYTLYNVAGGPLQYDEDKERITLYTDKVKESETLIVDTFKDILGDVYKGNITIQALLAMSSCASFTQEKPKLINDQKKFIKYFGTEQRLFDYSCFAKVQELICLKSKNYITQIVEINEQKMHSLARRACCNISQTIDYQKDNCIKLEDSLKKFKLSVSKEFSYTKKTISTELKLLLDNKMSYLIERIDSIIDDKLKDKQERAEKSIKIQLNDLSSGMETIVEEEVSSLREKIDQIKHRLDAEYANNIRIANSCNQINGDVDLGKAIGKMDIDLDDVIDFAGSVVGGMSIGSIFTLIAPGIATVIGGFVGAILYGLRKLCFGDGGKNKAKEEAHKSISKAKREIESHIDGIVKEINAKLDIDKNKITTLVTKELNELNLMGSRIREVMNEITPFLK